VGRRVWVRLRGTKTLAGGDCVARYALAGDAAELCGLWLLKHGQREAAALRVVLAQNGGRGCGRVHDSRVVFCRYNHYDPGVRLLTQIVDMTSGRRPNNVSSQYGFTMAALSHLLTTYTRLFPNLRICATATSDALGVFGSSGRLSLYMCLRNTPAPGVAPGL